MTTAAAFVIFLITYTLIAAASALLDNVTTVLLIAPVVLAVCRDLALPSGPFLISIVCVSNSGGTATLIGDPPNIMIASRSGLTSNDFLIHRCRRRRQRRRHRDRRPIRGPGQLLAIHPTRPPRHHHHPRHRLDLRLTGLLRDLSSTPGKSNDRHAEQRQLGVRSWWGPSTH
nr:SLC13 family permease [Jiangella muralis]